MRDARPAGVAVLGIATCLVLGWLSLASHGPPRPAGPEAPEKSFSAARATETVEVLARRPRPSGSAAHAEARHYLVARFQEMGLETELEEATVLRVRGDRLVGSRVANLLARLPGGGRPGAILLMAHYDTVPGSPGAGDDASGVAAIAETVRVLAAGPPLDRDVLVLLTDGEEVGLLGARAFVRDRERLADVALVLNFEARGSGGPVSMFESSSGNHRLVEELARAASWPVATSLSYEVYRRMPNDTDFSVLRRAGLVGLNFAMIGRYPSYHTRLDTVERLAAGSLQHHGSYALALTRHFAAMEEMPAAGAEGVYFNLIGNSPSLFFSYSSNTARVLASLLTILAAVALAMRSRRHHGRVAGAGWGALLAVAAGIAGLTAAIAVWRGMLLIAPGLEQAPHGVPWIAGWLTLAGALLTVAVVSALVRQFTGLAEAADLWAGVLVAWTVAAVATSFFLPGASYVFLWPAAAGWVGLGLAERFSGSRRRRVVVATVAAMPAVVLLTPVIGQLYEALTVRLAAPALVILAWVATLLVVPLAEVATWGRNWVEITLAAAALAVLATAALTGGPGPSTPATSRLLYVLDADLGRGFWVTTDRRPAEWTAAFLDAGSELESVSELLPGSRREARRGAAPALELAPPTLEVVPAADDPRRLRLRLSSPRGAPAIRARFAGEAPFRVVRVDGEPPPPELLAAGSGGARELDLTFFALPAGGIEVEIEAGEGRLELRLVDQTYGLPAIDGRVPRRPPGLIPPASWTSDSTFVSTRIVWPGRTSEELGDEHETTPGEGTGV